ncbi:MAG: hypothetical protein ACI865_000708 [Flavobacteriaceae bacterium]|jgi:hypothetical protein
MPEENNHIDHLFKGKLEGFEMQPPSDVWTKTAAAIGGASSSRRWIYLIGGILLIILLGLCYYLYQSGTNQSNTGSLNKNDSTELANSSFNETNTTIIEEKNNADSDKSKSSGESTGLSDRSTNVTTNVYQPSNKNKISSVSDRQSTHSTPSQAKASGVSSFSLTHSSSTQSSTPTAANPNEEKTLNPSELLGRLDFSNLASEVDKSESEKMSDVNSLPTRDILPNPFGSSKSFITSKLSLPNNKNLLNRLSIDISTGISTFVIAPLKSTPTVLNSIVANSSKDRASVDFSLGINYAFWRKFSVYSGIQYSKLSETVSYNESTIQNFTFTDTISQYFDSVTLATVYVIDTLSIDSTIIAGASSQNTYKLISIPFGISWTQRISAKSDLAYKLGGALNISSSYSGRIVSDELGTTVLAGDGYKTSGVLSVSFGLKYIYRFHPKHSIYIEPWVNRGVSVFNSTNLDYSTHLIQGGLRLGYCIQF